MAACRLFVVSKFEREVRAEWRQHRPKNDQNQCAHPWPISVILCVGIAQELLPHRVWLVHTELADTLVPHMYTAKA